MNRSLTNQKNKIMLIIEHILTIIATIFMLFGFARIVFSIGEHKENRNTLPLFVFILICKLFLFGFILFNIYNHISVYDLLKIEPPINNLIFVSLFDLLIIVEIYFTNKHLAVIDRYLYSNLKHKFPIYWRRSYNPIINEKNKFVYNTRTTLQILIGGLIGFELFFDSNLYDSFFLILYAFYIVTFIFLKNYFNEIQSK